MTNNEGRTRCEKFTRVMGYIRPVSHYNVWKKSEFNTRVCFDPQETMNSKFINDYTAE